VRASAVTIVTAAAVLLAAAPAGAVTGGFGVGKTLRANPILIASPATAAVKHRPASCDARDLRTRNGKKTSSGEHVTKQMAPVACEQPPRSQFISPEDLKHAVSAALAVLG
jgi:hypothetical protein